MISGSLFFYQNWLTFLLALWLSFLLTKADYSQRNVAKILGVSRNTVKKYWEEQTVPWERKPGSGRKNDIITDEVRTFIIRCLESDKNAPRKQRHTAHKIYERLIAEYGFEGCEASVSRTVAELKGKVSNVFVPLSYEPAHRLTP